MRRVRAALNNKGFYGAVSFLANAVLVFASILTIIDIAAPLMGGTFPPRAVAVHGSWIGSALILTYLTNYLRDKIRMKTYKWGLIALGLILTQLLWFPNYIGLLLAVFTVIAFVVAFRAQGQAGGKEGSEGRGEKGTA